MDGKDKSLFRLDIAPSKTSFDGKDPMSPNLWSHIDLGSVVIRSRIWIYSKYFKSIKRMLELSVELDWLKGCVWVAKLSLLFIGIIS